MKRITVILVIAASLLGCNEGKPSRGDAPRPRIVSFSPALTDMLYDMGLGDHVVGVTTYCMPPGNNPPPAVGNRFKVSAEAILSVSPDVILSQQNPDDFAAVGKIDPDVKVQFVRMETFKDIAETIERLGRITGRDEIGRQRKWAFLERLERVAARVKGRPRPRTLFVMGYERPSTGGSGTFIDDMIRTAGGIDAATDRGYSGWKMLNRENILAMRPDVLICQVSDGQEPAARKYWRTLGDLPAVQQGRVFIVTDRRWTIPSIRSAQYAGKLAEMIHPDEPGRSGR